MGKSLLGCWNCCIVVTPLQGWSFRWAKFPGLHPGLSHFGLSAPLATEHGQAGFIANEVS